MTLSPFAAICLVAAVCGAILGSAGYAATALLGALVIELLIADSRRRQNLPPQ